MRGIPFGFFVTFGVLTLAASTLAHEPAANPQDPKEIQAELKSLIQQLGSDAFDEREEASEKLRKHGVAARDVLKEATSSTDREIAARAKALLAEFQKAHENRGEVYVVGLYESRSQPAIVEITDTTKPIILVLCAYDRVTWQIKAAKGVDIVRVIASGYHAQTVEGVDAPVTNFSYDEGRVGPDGKTRYFYTYDHDEENYPRMVASVYALTGKKPKWFQGRYGFKKTPFVIAAPE